MSLAEGAQFLFEQGLRSRGVKGRILPGAVHSLLLTRTYCGEFEWKGELHKGTYTPLIPKELWLRVQDALEKRGMKRHRRMKHDFAYSGLITCGHCGCLLVGDIKKKRYIYYRCSGYRGSCGEPYVREEVLGERFGDALKGLRPDTEIADWIAEALRKSHGDEKRERDEAISRLQNQYRVLGNRLDVLYTDRLDGRIDSKVYDTRAAVVQAERDEVQRQIDRQATADRSYTEAGIGLIELAGKAHRLVVKQPPREKRRLLDFLVSNSSWRDGTLKIEFRQPFDMLMDTNVGAITSKAKGTPKTGRLHKWPARPDSNRGPSA
jgi:site-specific DNA recombinase